MEHFNNTKIVAKTADAALLVAWILIIVGGLLTFMGLFDFHVVMWRIYAGVAGIICGLYTFVLYAILRGIESMARASEAYLDSETEEIEH